MTLIHLRLANNLACGDPTFSAAVRRLTAAKVKPAVQFAEVPYRPHRAAGRTIAKDEEAIVGSRLSSDKDAIKKIQDRRGETAARKAQEGRELVEVALTPTGQLRG